jgi:hypothetical protein
MGGCRKRGSGIVDRSADGERNRFPLSAPEACSRPLGAWVVSLDTAVRMPVVVEELASNRPVPRWLERDGMIGQVVDYPHREDLDVRVDENLIVTFYAR